MKRIILNALVGAVIGVAVALLFLVLFTNETIRDYIVGGEFLNEYYVYILITLLAAAVSMLIVSYAMGRGIQNKNHSKTEESDELDDWTQRRFYNANIISNIAYLISLLGLAIAGTVVVINEDVALYFVLIMIGAFIVLFFVAAAITVYLAGLINKLYPERDLPTVNDKDYADKLLKVSDEGERHMILKGLYASFQTTQMALMLGVVIMIIVGAATETNQLFGILILLVILAISNIKYNSTIKKQL